METPKSEEQDQLSPPANAATSRYQSLRRNATACRGLKQRRYLQGPVNKACLLSGAGGPSHWDSLGPALHLRLAGYSTSREEGLLVPLRTVTILTGRLSLFEPSPSENLHRHRHFQLDDPFSSMEYSVCIRQERLCFPQVFLSQPVVLWTQKTPLAGLSVMECGPTKRSWAFSFPANSMALASVRIASHCAKFNGEGDSHSREQSLRSFAARRDNGYQSGGSHAYHYQRACIIPSHAGRYYIDLDHRLHHKQGMEKFFLTCFFRAIKTIHLHTLPRSSTNTKSQTLSAIAQFSRPPSSAHRRRVIDGHFRRLLRWASPAQMPPKFIIPLPWALAEAMPTPKCFRRAGYYPTFSVDSTTIHTISIVRNELGHLRNTQSTGHGKRSAHISSGCPVPELSITSFCCRYGFPLPRTIDTNTMRGTFNLWTSQLCGPTTEYLLPRGNSFFFQLSVILPERLIAPAKHDGQNQQANGGCFEALPPASHTFTQPLTASAAWEHFLISLLSDPPFLEDPFQSLLTQWTDSLPFPYLSVCQFYVSSTTACAGLKDIRYRASRLRSGIAFATRMDWSHWTGLRITSACGQLSWFTPSHQGYNFQLRIRLLIDTGGHQQQPRATQGTGSELRLLLSHLGDAAACCTHLRKVRAPPARRTNQSVRLRVRKLTVDQLAPRQSAWFPVWIFHPTPIPPRTPTFTPAPPAHPRPRAILFLSPVSCAHVSPVSPSAGRLVSSFSLSLPSVAGLHPPTIDSKLPQPPFTGLGVAPAQSLWHFVPWDLQALALYLTTSGRLCLAHAPSQTVWHKAHHGAERGSSPTPLLSPHSLAHRNAPHRTTLPRTLPPLFSSSRPPIALPESQSYHQSTRTHPPLTLPRPPPIAFLAPTYLPCLPFVLAIPQLSLSLLSLLLLHISLSSHPSLACLLLKSHPETT
ncbi:uncharacterized protein CLUP02_05186 [Colletotrichum lupini]|uniref:Uncharacterized protein n=1 Tax=Colletotrichum lupini TaxID=145971 RepID=A0A9Q8SMU7_9PEZI|nr:uncharacterized protein CLUP02_05186 [Colletotrichum lupini]UQC79706.1 hypothetical protein CLUP02_05186 [Colletotrichum lupini]